MKITLEFDALEELRSFCAEVVGTPAAPEQVAEPTAKQAAEPAATKKTGGRKKAEAPTSAPTATEAPTSAPKAQAAPTVPTAPAAPVAAATAPAKATYTEDQITMAAVSLVDAGKQQQLVQILFGFGANSIKTLPAEKYGEFMEALKKEGAKV